MIIGPGFFIFLFFLRKANFIDSWITVLDWTGPGWSSGPGVCTTLVVRSQAPLPIC